MANIATDLHKDEYKVIIIGALAVGKTSLLLRYVHNTFEDRISKFISEEKKSVVVNGREIVLHLWDTAGMLSAVYSGFTAPYTYVYPVYRYPIRGHCFGGGV